jgi:hypothetical protein
MIEILQNGNTANDASPTGTKIHDRDGRQTKGVCAYKTAAGSATVTLQGSFDNSTWFDITTLTSGSPVEVTLLPYMRATIASISGAVVYVWLYY